MYHFDLAKAITWLYFSKKLAELLSCRGKNPANNPLTYLFFLYALHASSADLKYPTCRLSSRTMISKSFISSSGAFFETVTVVNSGVVLDPWGESSYIIVAIAFLIPQSVVFQFTVQYCCMSLSENKTCIRTYVSLPLFVTRTSFFTTLPGLKLGSGKPLRCWYHSQPLWAYYLSAQNRWSTQALHQFQRQHKEASNK